MKEEQKDYLADALSEVSEEHITEAVSGGKRRPLMMVRMLTAAAALLLVTGAVLWSTRGTKDREQTGYEYGQQDTAAPQEIPGGTDGSQDKTEETGAVQAETDGKEVNQETQNAGGSIAEADEDVSIINPAYMNFNWDDYRECLSLIEECSISDGFSAAMNAFSYQTAEAVLADSPDNIMYSPLSLYYALAMTAYGAEGETAEEILGLLGVKDRQELAGQCNKLYQYFYYCGLLQDMYAEAEDGDRQNIIQLGNSLWIDQDAGIRESYRQELLDQFYARSYTVDFGSKETDALMSRWIREQTHGVLEPDLEFDENVCMAIVNTLYFYGTWNDEFWESLTESDQFTLADGSLVEADFMHKQEFGIYKEGDDYRAAILSTSNNCEMVFLLPDEGVDVKKFLNAEVFEETVGRRDDWESGSVNWSVPKFAFGSTLPLVDTLKSLGLHRMFTDEAEFGPTSEVPLCVSDVLQQTHIGVDEKGVEGAAVTIIVDKTTAVEGPNEPLEMNLNRPFLFGIQDHGSGAWLFIGVCQNPTQE